MGRGSVIIVAAIVLSSAVACSENDMPTPNVARPAPVVPPTPVAVHEKPSWRKSRYISIEEAVARLQPHVDIPIILPSEMPPGMPNLKKWLVDPKYLSWNRVNGNRVGELELVTKDIVISIDFGYASFDGCGGDLAIETNVLGQPALLNLSSEHLWSSLLWPVKEGEIAGRYGITGTLEGWQAIHLAESMELARLKAMKRQTGC